MIRRIFRVLDLSFCFTQRARDAQLASVTTGISVSLMYDGGLEVQAVDLVPAFHKGQPKVETLYVVGRILEGTGGAFNAFHAMYDPKADSWMTRAKGVSRKRGDDDLWLQIEEYEDAYRAAVGRMRKRAAFQH